MGGGDQVRLAEAATGEPVALGRQRLEHGEMDPQGLAPLAQGPGLGRTETQQRFFHPLVQQDSVDLVREPAVEPGHQPPGLGAFAGVGRQQEGGLGAIFQPSQNGGRLAQGQRFAGLGGLNDRRHAGRIELTQRAAGLPRSDQDL